jgi:aminoglycoside phosphotransferase (APT) family kinase protein
MDAEETSTNLGTPSAEFEIDSGLVATLIADQHPDLAHLPLQAIDAGWDNAMFRLGDHLAVRLPRRAAAANLIIHEQLWLPRLADHISLPVPNLHRVGAPALGYPWHWSIVEWLPGETADDCAPRPSEAKRWGSFLRSLHAPASSDAPTNAVRGGPLHQRAPAIEARIQRLNNTTNSISKQVRQIWNEALSVPIDLEPTWLHGDLHPRNVLVKAGVITGVIDWGDMTSGDPATDLASIWMLFDEPQAWRDALAAYAQLSQATLARAKGWAILLGIVLLDSGLVDRPKNAAIGEHTLRRVAQSIERS